MVRNTFLVCSLAMTLLISLSPFAYGEKQDANEPATQLEKTKTQALQGDPNASILKDAVIKNGMGPVAFLRFSPDGHELVRICQFGKVELFDTISYNKARTFRVGMRMVAYSPDGTKIATAEGTDGARVWNSMSPGKLIENSEELVVSELYLLDTPLKILQLPSQDANQRVFWTEFSPDGKRLITTHASGHVKVWDTKSWTLETELTLTDTEVRVATFAPDSKTIVIGDVNSVLHEWNFELKAETKTIHTLGAVMGIAFAPDGKTLVTTHLSSSSSFVMNWNTSTWISEVKSGFKSAAFSKDGKILAFGGTRIELIDPATRKQIRIIELPEMTLGKINRRLFEGQPNSNTKVPIRISALAFSPDGNTLAAGCEEGTVRLVKMNQ